MLKVERFEHRIFLLCKRRLSEVGGRFEAPQHCVDGQYAGFVKRSDECHVGGTLRLE